MASPVSEKGACSQDPINSRRLQCFRRSGKNGPGRQISMGEDVQNSGSIGKLQVLIPGFESVDTEDSRGETAKEQRRCEMANTLIFSPGGRQSAPPPSSSAEKREEMDGDELHDVLKGSNSGPNQNPSSLGMNVNDGGFDDRTVSLMSLLPIGFCCSPSHLFFKFLVHCTNFLPLHARKQTPGKRVEVSQDVLDTYHESFLYGKVALSTRVRAGIRGPFLSTVLLSLECIAAVLLLALYVRTTYTEQNPRWITIVQLCCSSFFLLDYLIKLYSSPVRLYYAFSINGIIDFISTLPIYFILSGVMSDAAIPEVFLVFRILRAVPLVSAWALPGGAVAQEIFMLVAYALGVFFLAAGVLQWVEWRATPPSVMQSNGCPAYGCLSFYEALYFIVVTVSTVGYGDITLNSNWGRLVAIFVIIAAVVFIPVEVNKILDVAARRPYGGKYAVRKVVGSRFIIMSGIISYRALEDFLSEFYHPSHSKDMPAYPLRVVVMAPFKPSFEMKVLLTEYKGRVEFIEGTPLKDSDLERVSANVASAFFLMADHLAKDPEAEDAAQIMRALSVYRFCGSKVRLIVEMLKPENQDNPIWDDADGGIEIVCPEAVCYQLLARSCQVKGLSTLIINLFKSGLQLRNPAPGSWLEQYSHGQQQEIYPVILPPCFCENDVTFEEAAEVVYLEFEIILFGLDILTEDEGGREVLLFPKKRILKLSDIGLVIAENVAIAEKVSKYGKYHGFHWSSSLCNKKLQSDDMDIGLLYDLKKRRLNSNSFNNGSKISGSERRTDRQSQESASRSFGMMNFGHRAERQTQLREIVCTPTIQEEGPTGSIMTFQRERDKGFSQEQNNENQKVYSLEEAIDLITQWPPSTPEKPDYPVLRKRAGVIEKNLKERTLKLVDLEKPHVLLCVQGKWPANLFCFVEQLRIPFALKPPIVIIHPEVPITTDWGCVGMFEDVYFLQGSPIYEIDLIRAGVLQAEKVVLFSQRGRVDGDKDPTSDDSGLSPSSLVLDVDNVMITATIERLLHPACDRIIVELHREIEIHYLRPKLRIRSQSFDPMLFSRNRSATFLFAPSFVEGKGFCSASLTFLLYALFFNRNTVAITQKLISGEETVEGKGGKQVVGKRLEQVIVPKIYEGRSYGEMVVGMLQDKQWLALGLYRPAGCCNSIVSYVYTNPRRHELLVSGDLVYVLR